MLGTGNASGGDVQINMEHVSIFAHVSLLPAAATSKLSIKVDLFDTPFGIVFNLYF
tara:strand:- start:479 stop:646 length:168 start_codon:yes stop_codon:yes gene_type:complete